MSFVAGLAHFITHTNYIVSLHGKQDNQITKKTENDNLDDQTGGGNDQVNESMDISENNDLPEALLHSLKHPRLIETGVIEFQSEKPVKRKIESIEKISPSKQIKLETNKPGKKRPMKHKFNFL